MGKELDSTSRTAIRPEGEVAEEGDQLDGFPSPCPPSCDAADTEDRI